MFHVYILFLILGGIAMLVMAGIGGAGQKPVRRILHIVLGAVFTIYGLYLLLFFHGGHYTLFYYVFIIPIVLIVQFFRDRSAAQVQQASSLQARPPTTYGQVPNYGQPAGYGQPFGFDQPADDQLRGQ